MYHLIYYSFSMGGDNDLMISMADGRWQMAEVCCVPVAIPQSIVYKLPDPI